MDALTASTAFATIVGLICNFRQERGADKQLDHQQFLEWLEYHQHQEIKNLIANTYHLQAEVDQLLRADHEIIIKKLDMLGSAMASLSSQITDLRPLALKLVPSAELSDQAVSILRQALASEEGKFGRIKAMSGDILALAQARAGGITYQEAKFLEDDLRMLVELNLLAQSFSSKGTEIYSITRNAVRLINAIDSKS